MNVRGVAQNSLDGTLLRIKRGYTKEFEMLALEL